ncbi:Lin1244/Lin1753 domain-containing protein [Companilactobacillus metriopterae]|uniref:Lin1244/Lin1753 domain-containing protein n=1 Tax=Companilactobacillus metriopterae TaxID=1909267 RepID=UPI001F507E8C|nr:Lin1244/Lin1753 domain-containing protein [Companilactobacillus metriopterae]
MARPVKDGLDYFPFDVDFPDNKKTSAIMGEFGSKGVLMMVYLLSAVYKKGYFLQWDKLTEMQLVNKVEGLNSTMANQIVTRLVAYGTFDEELFNSVSVLTSQRIQETYLDATKRRKSQKPSLYWINVNNNDTSNEVNVDINTQSKVKESKLNKTKDNKTSRSKSKKRTYEPDDVNYQLATKLFEKILEHNSEFKKPNLQKWADDIRLMHEQDNRDYTKISNMIDWCQADGFWYANILSAKKLREKYDQMKAQASQQFKKQSNNPNRRIEKGTDWSKKKAKTVEQTDDIQERLARIRGAKSGT